MSSAALRHPEGESLTEEQRGSYRAAAFVPVLERYMTIRGHTQTSLGEGIGDGQPQVSKWLDGRRPTLGAVIRMDEFLEAGNDLLLAYFEAFAPEQAGPDDPVMQRVAMLRRSIGEVGRQRRRDGPPASS